MKHMRWLVLTVLCLTLAFALCACAFGEVGTRNDENTTTALDDTGVTPDACVHHFGEWVEAVAPTCTRDGRETRVCSLCDTTENRALEALQHDEIDHGARVPTCTAVGWNAYVTCARCTYSTYREIAPSHDVANYDPNCAACIEVWGDVLVLNFELNGAQTEYTVTGIADEDVSTVVIPSVYKGKPVTGIGANAFRGCTDLSSVAIPESVMYVGDDAFYGCTRLSAVAITELAAWCKIDFVSPFSNPLCYAGKLYIDGELATEIVIPDGVTGIGAYAFRYCTSLTDVTLPDGVTCIEPYAFGNCTSLRSVALPDSLTRIEAYTFNGCTGLTDFTIPDSVTGISQNAFWGCVNLIQTENGISYVDKWVIGGDESLVDATLRPDTVGVGEQALYSCYRLNSITVPDSLKWMDNAPFHWSDDNLTAVYITDLAAWCEIGFAFVDSNPLYYAGKLYINGELVTEIVIPDGVTSIGNYAFYGCTELTSVTIPDDVTDIGYSAFYGCDNIKIATVPTWAIGAIPQSSLETVVLNGGETIGERAFGGCVSLRRITIPSSVTSIAHNAFDGCYKLVEIYNLSSLSLTAGSREHGYVAYHALGIYTSLDTASKVWTDENGFAFYEDGEACYLLGYFGSQPTLTLPASCHGKRYAIHDYAFYDCDSLTSITVPDGVTGIGNDAFHGCTSLESITIPNSVASIENMAFYYCYSLSAVYYGGTVDDWSAIGIGDYNSNFIFATRYYYSDTEPTDERNYWYYDEHGNLTTW